MTRARDIANQGAGTFGSITADDLTVDTTTLVVDETNNRVGIGTSSPAVKLDLSQSTNDSVIRIDAGVDAFMAFGANGTATENWHIGTVDSDSSFRFYSGNYGSGTERIRINSGGAVKMSSTGGVFWNTSGTYHESSNAYASQPAHLMYSTNGSFVNEHLSNIVLRSASSAYAFYKAYSGNVADTEFTLRGDGQAYADGSWNGGGADYAEYFEWADGNTSNEDRRGYTVVLDGEKVRKATDEDDASQIIGAVSAMPCVIGDHADNKWSGKFLKDDFGNYIREEHNVVEWTDEEGKHHSYEDWKIPEGIIVPDDATVLTHDDNGNRFDHRKLNPDFDPDAEYITRENRPEWSPIGMMGKLRIRKGQPVGDRWIKMRDVSETVEEWLVR